MEHKKFDKQTLVEIDWPVTIGPIVCELPQVLVWLVKGEGYYLDREKSIVTVTKGKIKVEFTNPESGVISISDP